MTRRTRTTLALSAAAVVVAVAVAVLAFDGGGGGPATLPVRAGGGDDAAMSEAAAGAESSDAAMPAMIGGGVTWEVADGLPALDGEAPAYRLLAPTEDEVARLAAALGLDGDVTAADGMLRVVDGDRMLEVMDHPGGPWSYYQAIPVEGGDGIGGSTGSSGSEGEAGSSAPSDGADGAVDSTIVTEVAPVEPDVPTEPLVDEATAEQAARAVAEGAGIDLANATVAVDAAAPDRVVRIDPAVGDLPTWGMTTYVGVGEGGRITWANGTFGRAEEADTYPLIGTAAAESRLGTGIPGGPVALDGGDAAVSHATEEEVTEEAVTDDVAVTEEAVTDEGGTDEGTTDEEGVAVAGEPGTPACDPELGPDGDAATRDACPPGAAVEPAPVPCDDTVGDTAGMCAAPCDPATGPDGDAATDDGCPPAAPAPDVAPCDPATGPDGDPATEDACPAVDCPEVDDSDQAGTCIDPMPVAPEPIVAQVTGVRLGLVLVPSADGTGSWLIPAYLWDAEYEGSDAASVEVTLAIADEHLLPATGDGD